MLPWRANKSSKLNSWYVFVFVIVSTFSSFLGVVAAAAPTIFTFVLLLPTSNEFHIVQSKRSVPWSASRSSRLNSWYVLDFVTDFTGGATVFSSALNVARFATSRIRILLLWIKQIAFIPGNIYIWYIPIHIHELAAYLLLYQFLKGRLLLEEWLPPWREPLNQLHLNLNGMANNMF